MEGLILAAGLGKRLKSLTVNQPKALVSVGGVTLLERTIHRMEEIGVTHIVVNVHHFADMIVDTIRQNQWQATVSISDERALLLGTGGALRHAAPLFSGNEDILVHNVDILSDIDLCDVERKHREEGNLVTLCVSKRDSKRLLAFDADGRLVDRAESLPPTTGTRSLVDLAFSGISVLSPELFSLLPEDDHPYEIIDEYIRLSREGYRIGTYLHSGDEKHWTDVGKPDTLEKAQQQWTVSSDK